MRAKCSDHFAAANKRRKVKLIQMIKNADKSGRSMEEQISLSKGQSAARMMKFRLKRVAIISEISDAKVKAIAEALDCIKEKHEYVIVPSVIDESVIASQIKLKGKKEPITFSSPTGPYLRSMQEVIKPDLHVNNVYAALSLVFPLCTMRKLKLLRSKAGDVAQITHTDYVPPGANFRSSHCISWHRKENRRYSTSFDVIFSSRYASCRIRIHHCE